MANNQQVSTQLAGASAQRMGAENISAITLEDIVSAGVQWDDIEKNQWASDLSAAYMKTLYTDAEYNDKTDDIFYEDSSEFGAITRVISVELPDIIDNRAWTAMTSGVSTIGSNTVYLPVANEQLYVRTASWSIPIAFTGTQLNEAFDSVEGLRTFESYVRLSAENGGKYHRATMNMMNRNNYIGEKLHAKTSGVAGVHVVNLVEEYAKFAGVGSLTAANFMKDANAMRHSARIIMRYINMIKDFSTLFTLDTNSKGKFVPENRLAFQLLADFEAFLATDVYSTVFHDTFVKMPLFRRVNSWQGMKSATSTASFAELSTINVTTSDGHSVNQSGIIGLLCDKWSIMHTIVKHRVGVQRDDIKDVTLNDYQFTDKYMNNLTLPGIVFVVQDYSA